MTSEHAHQLSHRFAWKTKNVLTDLVQRMSAHFWFDEKVRFLSAHQFVVRSIPANL